MKYFLTITILANILLNTGCVSMALEAMKKIPSQKDVETMEVGKTKYDDVAKKWPDYNRNIVNDKICLIYSKVNAAAQLGVIGGKADMISLCFKDGLLTDRSAN